MSWIDDYKGEGPWDFDEQKDKLHYNEGNLISDHDNPIWKTDFLSDRIGKTPITSEHHPWCGYWTKIVVPVSESEDSGLATFALSGAFFFTASDFDFFVMVVNAEGVKWTKRFWLTSDRIGYGRSLIEVSDGIIIAGTSIKSSLAQHVIVKVDKNDGTVIWSTVMDGTASDEQIMSIIELSGGGLVYTGWAYRDSIRDICIVKLMSSGSLDWAKTISGASFNDTGHSIIEMFDGLLVAGYTKSSAESNKSDAVLIKLLYDGTIDWSKRYNRTGTQDSEIFTDVQETSDYGLITVGFTYEYGVGYGDILIAKLGLTGDISWSLRIRADHSYASRTGYKIREVSDGYIIVGYHPDKVSITKITLDGNWSWSKKLTSASSGNMYNGDTGALTITDTGIAFAGISYNSGIGAYDMLVAYVDLDGEIPGCGHISDFTPSTEAGNIVANSLGLSTSTLTISADSHTLNELSPEIGFNNYCSSDEFFALQLSTNLKNFEPYEMIKLS